MDLCGRGLRWSGGARASSERACSTVRCVSTSVSSTPGAGAGGGRGRGGLCATPPAAGGAAARDTPSSFSGMRTYCGPPAAARTPCPASAVVGGPPMLARPFAPAPLDFFSLRPENRKFANRERKPAMRLRGARAPASVIARAHSATGARGPSPLPSTTITSASASSMLALELSLVVRFELSALLVLVSCQLTSATTGEKVTPFDPADTERTGGAESGGGGGTSCSDARNSSGVSRCGVARALNSGVERTRASPERSGVDEKAGIGSGDGERGGDGVGDDGSILRRSSSRTSSHAPHESCNLRAVSTESSRS